MNESETSPSFPVEREKKESNQARQVIEVFSVWSSKFIDYYKNRQDNSDYDSRYTSEDFVQEVSEILGDQKYKYVSDENITPDLLEKLSRWFIQTLQGSGASIASQNEYTITYEIEPDWIIWNSDFKSLATRISIGKKFELIFNQDSDLLFAQPIYERGTANMPVNRQDAMNMSDLIDVIVTADPIDREGFDAFERSRQIDMLKRSEDITNELESRYVILVESINKYLGLIHEFRKLSQDWDKAEETKELLYGASQELQKELFPNRKKSIKESDDLLGDLLLEFDKKKADLHAKIVSFRHITERGIGRNEVTADLEMRIRARSKDKVAVFENVLGVWVGKDNLYGMHIDDPGFSIILGSSEIYTNTQNDMIPAREPYYKSFVSDERSRKQDVDLTNEIISAVTVEYPKIHGFNNLKISGSFHEKFAGCELVFKKSEIYETAEEGQVSLDDIARGICKISAECIKKSLGN